MSPVVSSMSTVISGGGDASVSIGFASMEEYLGLGISTSVILPA